MLKTRKTSRLSLTSFVEMKSPHSGRVRGIKALNMFHQKNREGSDQRADVAMDWYNHKSSPEHVWEHFLSWTFMCFFPFLSVDANSYIPEGNRNFSTALKLLPWCNQSNKTNNNHLFHGNIARIKLENLAVVEKHFIPPSILPFHTTVCLSGDTRNMLLQLLWKTIVFMTTYGTVLSSWGTIRGFSVTFGFWQTYFKSFVCSILPAVGKQALEAVMASSHLAGPLGCSSLWIFHNNFRKQEIFSPWFISLVSSLSVTAFQQRKIHLYLSLQWIY